MRGGRRAGAGRPRLFNEPSVPIRVPESMREQIKDFVKRLAVVDRGDPVCLTNSDMAKILRDADIWDFCINRSADYQWEVTTGRKPSDIQLAKVRQHPYLEGQTVQFRYGL